MDCYFYTLEEIDRLRKQVEALGLEVPDGFRQMSPLQLQQECNGCGAESMPEKQRRVLTAALAMYEAAFFVHDAAYALIGKGEADDMMYRNMVKIVRYNFGTFWWLKKSALIERFTIIPAVYGIVAVGGDDAYEAAQKDGE